jgi:membrane-bound metal-dependent hydrolase YbcI (DUF457 family)
MIVGHALLAFAIAATLAGRFAPPERAIALGAIAGAFAVTPDIDVTYGIVGVLDALIGTGTVVESFWSAGLIVHRGLTHSLLIGALLAVAVGLCCVDERQPRWSVVGGGLIVAIVILGASGGVLTAVSALLFVALGLSIARIATVRFDLGPAQTTGLAAIGLLSHPVGDLFTGEPPHLLYPSSIELVPGRIALAADPTLHLLGTFALELVAAWLGLVVLARLRSRPLSGWIAPRAVAGASFGVAALVLAPPTLETPYLFTGAVLPIAAGVGASCWFRPPMQWDRPSAITVVATGVAALSLALLAYAIVYVVL